MAGVQSAEFTVVHSLMRLVLLTRHCLKLQQIRLGRALYSSRKMAEKFVDDAVKEKPVVMFSKSYCPFCDMAKKSLKEAGLTNYPVYELDQRGDGSAIQDILLAKTGARSVPRVFINGVCVGGGTDVKALQDSGKLVGMLKDAGAL